MGDGGHDGEHLRAVPVLGGGTLLVCGYFLFQPIPRNAHGFRGGLLLFLSDLGPAHRQRDDMCGQEAGPVHQSGAVVLAIPLAMLLFATLRAAGTGKGGSQATTPEAESQAKLIETEKIPFTKREKEIFELVLQGKHLMK